MPTRLGLVSIFTKAMPTRIEIETVSGDKFGTETFCAKGHFKNPMSAAEVEAKFRKLTAGISVRETQVRAYYLEHRGLYGVTPLARVAPAIRSQLLSARKNAALSQWLAKVRSTEPKAVLD